MGKRVKLAAKTHGAQNKEDEKSNLYSWQFSKNTEWIQNNKWVEELNQKPGANLQNTVKKIENGKQKFPVPISQFSFLTF